MDTHDTFTSFPSPNPTKMTVKESEGHKLTWTKRPEEGTTDVNKILEAKEHR